MATQAPYLPEQGPPIPPLADDPFIRVTVDGHAFRVHYAGGKPYWVQREYAHGPSHGFPLSLCGAGTFHLRAAELAESFLDGLRKAGQATA